MAALYLDALHGDVVDDSNDTTRAGYGQQGVAGVGVVRPCTRVEVFICLSACGQVKMTSHTDGHIRILNTGTGRKLQKSSSPLVLY